MQEAIETEVRLPRPPGVFRRALAAHPRAVDVFIVVWYFIGTGLMALVEVASSTQFDPRPIAGFFVWPGILLTVVRTLAVAAALLLRRRFPLSGLIVTCLAMFGDQGALGLANSVALCFLLYAVPVYRSVRAGWIGYGIAMGAHVILTIITLVSGSVEPVDVTDAVSARGASTPELAGGSLVITAIWLLAVLMVGINLGNRRRYVEAIIDRAHQLARERDQRAQLAVAEERSRIAREMHDIVAHSVSVMIALSEGAARAADAAPEAAADAMRRSAETGRTALAEMRRLLGALNEPGAAELAPQPGVEDLGGLVSGFRDAGLEVRLEVSAPGLADRGQDLAIYRVVQEALTNALRYAGSGARVDVSVRSTAGRIVVEVRDHGPGPGAPPAAAGLGSGRGLAGLAERVRVFGGAFASGPVGRSDGPGWLVRAEFPQRGGAERGERAEIRPADGENGEETR